MKDPHYVKDSHELEIEEKIRKRASDIVMKTNEWVMIVGNEILYGFDDGEVAENVVVGAAEKIKRVSN